MQSAVEADVDPQNYDVLSNVTRVYSFRLHITRSSVWLPEIYLTEKPHERKNSIGWICWWLEIALSKIDVKSVRFYFVVAPTDILTDISPSFQLHSPNTL